MGGTLAGAVCEELDLLLGRTHVSVHWGLSPVGGGRGIVAKTEL